MTMQRAVPRTSTPQMIKSALDIEGHAVQTSLVHCRERPALSAAHAITEISGCKSNQASESTSGSLKKAQSTQDRSFGRKKRHDVGRMSLAKTSSKCSTVPPICPISILASWRCWYNRRSWGHSGLSAHMSDMGPRSDLVLLHTTDRAVSPAPSPRLGGGQAKRRLGHTRQSSPRRGLRANGGIQARCVKWG